MARRLHRRMIQGLWREVKTVTDYNEVKTMDRDQAIAAGLYQVIGSDVDDVYIAQLKTN